MSERDDGASVAHHFPFNSVRISSVERKGLSSLLDVSASPTVVASIPGNGSREFLGFLGIPGNPDLEVQKDGTSVRGAQRCYLCAPPSRDSQELHESEEFPPPIFAAPLPFLVHIPKM